MNTTVKQNEPFSMKKELMDIISSEFGEILTDMEKGNVYKSTQRLPLHLFENNFLPYFKGEVTDKEESDKLKRLWLSVAGHAGRNVDIFDPKTDETLFTIPSFVNGNIIDPTKSEAFSFALRQYKYHTERSQSTAIMYLIKNKDRITENVIVNNPTEVKIEGWKSFINYYKLGKSDSTTNNNQNENDSVDDFFDFGI